MALFGGAYLANRRLAFVLPIAAMLLSDLVLGTPCTEERCCSPSRLCTLAFWFTVAIGRLVKDRRSPLQVGSATLASSILVLCCHQLHGMGRGPLVPLHGRGLASCYLAAIPFLPQ